MKASIGLLLGAVLLGGGYYAWRTVGHKDVPAPASAPVPVTTAAAKEQTVPEYLRGIGTVRALNSVEVHPQVGGVLLQVPVREGDEVHKGDVLAVIDPRAYQVALDKARAQRQQDQSQLANAQADQRRYATLAQRDFASRQQVDTQQAAVARYEGVIAADDAAIEDAQINLGYCVVHSPLDGRVGLRRVDPGNLVQANMTGQGILSVVQGQPISVVFTLPEGELPRVRAAMARGAVPVLADSSDLSKQLAQGVLLTPDNAVDPASGTIGLKATFDNTDGMLTPGQFVSVRLQADVAHGVTMPHEAVQHGQGGELFVYVVKPGDTIERRVVQVAYDDGVVTVAGKGVMDGDAVVTAGQTRIGPGTKVATQPPPPGQGQAGQSAAK